MALQNRVHPLGDIVAAAQRGGLMGNRGGRIHRDDQTLGSRRWASKAWIACRTEFKDRRRAVMGRGYTELFFLDEATALAAGHRPCYECRREDAKRFAEAWAAAKHLDAPPRAAEIDAALHAERVARKGGRRRLNPSRVEALPPGAVIALWGGLWLATDDYLLRWSFEGYQAAVERRGAAQEIGPVVTPPSIFAALAAGYRPDVASTLF